MEVREHQANDVKSEELLQLIESLEPNEKWKLLDKMYDKYYDKGELPSANESSDDSDDY